MDTSLFDYHLPDGQIAREPIEPRDAARLLVAGQDIPADHRQVRDLPGFLRPGDLLVLNRTKVIPARLEARTPSGGAREVLLVHPEDGQPDAWRCLVGGKVRPGSALTLDDGTPVTVTALHDDGARTVAFPPGTEVIALAERIGHIPLPPYLHRADRPEDRQRYQTVFAEVPGSVAAPTASLHLTPTLLETLTAQGVHIAKVELRIGPGTFKPVDTDRVEDFRIHAEWCACPPETVAAVAACKARGGRVFAIGTTVVRTLETAAQGGELQPWSGWTRLFCHPPWRPRVVDGLLTNFHLPKSSLLMLVACFTGIERIQTLYAQARDAGYRFYSYGDAMLWLPERRELLPDP